MLKPLTLHQKVKLKLVQPDIKCNGRKDVTCYYRGKVIETYINFVIIEIKVHNQPTLVEFAKINGLCFTPGFEDLIIQ